MMKENLQLPPRSVADKKMNHDPLPPLPPSPSILHIYATLRKIPRCEHTAQVAEEKLKRGRGSSVSLGTKQTGLQWLASVLNDQSLGRWSVCRCSGGRSVVTVSPFTEQLSVSAEAGNGNSTGIGSAPERRIEPHFLLWQSVMLINMCMCYMYGCVYMNTNINNKIYSICKGSQLHWKQL